MKPADFPPDELAAMRARKRGTLVTDAILGVMEEEYLQAIKDARLEFARWYWGVTGGKGAK